MTIWDKLVPFQALLKHILIPLPRLRSPVVISNKYPIRLINSANGLEITLKKNYSISIVKTMIEKI